MGLVPYNNLNSESTNKNGTAPPLRKESAIPPVLQQTTKLYQPYILKKEDNK